MSRLGRKPIEIPAGVKVSLSDGTVRVEGPVGKLSYKLVAPIQIKVDEPTKKISVQCESQEKRAKALHGLTRSLLANMVVGVSKGFEKQLEVNGVGYNAKVQGKQLILVIGYSHPIAMDIPEGLTVSCPSATLISVKGADKQLVGEFSAEVRMKRPVEPYNLKGIRYKDEVVRKKAGKTFVSGTA